MQQLQLHWQTDIWQVMVEWVILYMAAPCMHQRRPGS